MSGRLPQDPDSPYPPTMPPREAIRQSLTEMHWRWCLLLRRMIEQRRTAK